MKFSVFFLWHALHLFKLQIDCFSWQKVSDSNMMVCAEITAEHFSIQDDYKENICSVGARMAELIQ